MAEYLGYINPAETKANPTLDWSTVINDVRDTLSQQEAGREANRQKAMQDTNDLYGSLNKISSGQNQGLNGFITNASYQSKNMLGEAYKLYTSGKISNKQYTNIQNNMRGSFSDINDIVKTMQSDYERYIELSQKGETSIIDDYNQKQKGEAIDLSNKEFYVDPLTGTGYIGKVIDGKIDQSSLQPTAWIKNNGSSFVGKVDISKEIAPYTKDIGKFQEVLNNPPAGGIWSIEDASRKPGFSDWLDKSANAIASSPYKIATILGQITDYSLVDSADKVDKGKILMQRDLSTGMNTPVITPEQEKEAKDYIKSAILMQVNSTIKQEENTYRPPATGDGSGGGDKLPKGQSATEIQIPENGKGAYVPMSGVNIKIGPKTENISEWGIDSNGKLFVNVVTAVKDYALSLRDGSIIGETKKTTYSENNIEFKKRLKYLINPNTNRNISSLAEAKSVFGNTSNEPKKVENLRSKYNY